MSKSERQSGLVAGIILVVIGIALLLVNLDLFEPQAFILALGISFLVAYAFWRLLGLLIPGMILTWLGAAILLLESNLIRLENEGSIILVFLGLAFISIYAFMGGKRHWWPLIPGSILLLLGIIILLVTEDIIPLTVAQIFNLILPAILILVGVWLIFRQYFRR